MNDDGFVHNVRLDDHFTTTHNRTPADPRLSWGAKGLLWYILSRGNGWRVKTWQLSQIFEGKGRGNGKPAIRGFLTELREAEYIIYSKEKDEKGRWIHNYHTYPMPYPQIKIMFPETVKPPLVKPHIIPSKELDQERKLPKEKAPKKKAVVVPLFLSEISGLGEEKARSLLRTFSLELLEKAVKILKTSTTPVPNPYGFLKKACKERWEFAPSREQTSEANKKILDTKFRRLEGKVIGITPICVGPGYIEFTNIGCGASTTFDIKDANFEARVDAHLKLLRDLESITKAKKGVPRP